MSDFQLAFTVLESECDHIRALLDAEVQKRKNFEVILAEVWCHLNDHSSFHRSSHDMCRYDVGRALQDYLRPSSHAARKRRATFLSVSSSQVVTHGEMLPQSAVSIVSFLYRRLWSSSSVYHKG